MILFYLFILILIGSTIYRWFNWRKLEGVVYSTKNSVFLLVIGSIYLTVGIMRYFEGSEIQLVFLPIGMTLFFQAFDNLKAGNNGICISSVFLSWDEIEFFQWDLDNTDYLIIKIKTRRFFLLGRRKIKSKIAKDEKYQVDLLLKEHVVKGC